MAFPTTNFQTGTVITSDWLNAVNEKCTETVSVKDFGAVGDGVTDDTAAIQAALNQGGGVFLPAGSYKVGALVITKRVTLYGEGSRVSKLISTVTGSVDALTVIPSINNNTFYNFMDFGIEPETINNGRNGLRVTLNSGQFFSNSVIERIYIGDFGSEGLYLDNSIYSNVNGFFTLAIRKNWVTNGVKILKGGDSITIAENTITGDLVGFYITSIGGARQIVIKENNVTTSGGSFYIESCDQITIANNQCEQVAAVYTNPYSVDAMLYIKNCLVPCILGNTVTPKIAETTTSATTAIKLDGTTFEAILNGNVIAKGSSYHLTITSNVSFSNVDAQNTYYDAGSFVSPIVSNSGNATIGLFLNNVTPVNSWVAFDSTNNPLRIVKTSDGRVEFQGILKDGITTSAYQIAIFPDYFAPDKILYFTVPNKNGSTWGTAIIKVHPEGSIGTVAVTGNTELHLTGISYYQESTNY